MNKLKSIRVVWLSVMILLLILGSGCMRNSFFENPTIVSNVEQLGSVQVTLHKPYLYKKYQKELQPNFKLSETEALKKSIPTTMGVYGYRGQSTKVSAEIKSPGSGFDIQEKIHTDEDGVETSTKDETYTKKSSELPVVQVDNEHNLRTDIDRKEIEFDKEPHFQYANATSLFQAVKLINQQFENFDYGDDYVPYVANIQITTMPLVRNAPYDAFIDINLAGINGKKGSFKPIIVPLLVTDSVEQRSSQFTSEQFRQLSLSIAALAEGVGFGFGISDAHKLIRMAIGKDYNSLLTVGRIGDDTLRVRVGAMQQPGSGYAMLDRNYMVTVVVIVKKDDLKDGSKPGALRKTSVVQIVDATSGKRLFSKYQQKSKETREQEVLAIANQTNVNHKLQLIDAESLLKAVSTGDKNLFVKTLYPELRDKLSENAEKKQTQSQLITLLVAQLQSIDVNSVLPQSIIEQKTNVLPQPLPPLSELPTDAGVSERFSDPLSVLWLRILGSISNTGIDINEVPLENPEPKPLCIKRYLVAKTNGSAACTIDLSEKTCIDTSAWICDTEPLTILDNGKKSVVIVSPVGNARSSKVTARIYSEQNGNAVSFTANSITHVEGSDEILFTFDSLVSWGVKSVSKLEIIDIAGEHNKHRYQFNKVGYFVMPSKNVSDIKLLNNNGVDFIAVDAGKTKGSVKLQIKGTIDNTLHCVLKVDKAYIAGSTTSNILGTITLTNGKLLNNVILNEGFFDLSLENLANGEKIKLYGEGLDGSKTNTLTFTVKVSPSKPDTPAIK